eukprot:8672953-Pyramimonas_sp.AAC.2
MQCMLSMARDFTGSRPKSLLKIGFLWLILSMGCPSAPRRGLQNFNSHGHSMLRKSPISATTSEGSSLSPASRCLPPMARSLARPRVRMPEAFLPLSGLSHRRAAASVAKSSAESRCTMISHFPIAAS